MLDIITELYGDDLLIADGFDKAIIGVSDDFSEPRIIYSVKKCLKILKKDMGEEGALEYFTYNVSGAYLGEQTPIFCWDIF